MAKFQKITGSQNWEKLLDMAETASGSKCSEHEMNMLQELNMAKQGTTVFY